MMEWVHARRILVALGVLVLAVSRAAAAPQAAEAGREVREALARPLTPAAVALLLPHTSQPQVVQRLEAALRDPDPDVRAVAARVAFTTRQQRLAAALTAAIASESEVRPAAEMARALALIVGQPSDDAAFTAMARTGSSVGEAWLGVVARTRPADALSRLPALGGSAGAFLANFAAADPEAAARAFAALATTPSLEQPFLALVQRLEREGSPVPSPLIGVGLNGPAVIRHATVRLLLHRRASGAPLPPEAEPALAQLRSRTSATDDPYLAMTFELLRRGEKGSDPPVPLAPIIARLDRDTFPGDSSQDGWLRRLEPAEEAALRERVRLLPRDQWAPASRPSSAKVAVTPAPADDMLVRMVRPLTPRLVTELGELTGCRPRRDQVLAAQVAFRPTGQVRQVFKPVGNGVERCAQAASLLAALDVADGHAPIPPTRTDLILVGFRPEDATCPRVARAGNEMRAGSGDLRPPRKVRHVDAIYPPDMLDQRIQGVVLIEAIVGPMGCIGDAVVLSGPSPTLKAAALVAVSLWQYEPSLLDGKPVPIIMTVTVNFTM
jgi:TonB family protein